jgi:hypothetical protein
MAGAPEIVVAKVANDITGRLQESHMAMCFPMPLTLGIIEEANPRVLFLVLRNQLRSFSGCTIPHHKKLPITVGLA